MTKVAPDSVVPPPDVSTPALSEEGAALDKVAQKRAAQHLENQQAAVDFIETTIGRKLGNDSLHESLRNGVVLCELMNKLKPGSISIISTRDAPFLQMENINRFLTASKNLGLKGHELFQTVDLFEGKDMQQVIITILTIARVIAGSPLKSRPPDELNPYRNEVIVSEDAPPQKPVPVHTKSISVSHFGNTRPVTPSGMKKADSDRNLRAPRTRTESPHRSSRPGSRASSVRGSKTPAERITLGPYQLGSSIGKGQFGTVYQALNMETGQVAAIKRIPLADRKEQGVQELMQEVELLKSLTHPNIVKYLGFVLQEGYLNIILEFMECGSLQSVMKKYNLLIPEKLAAVYVENILEGLQYLHEKGVVHCDLKCANILTTKDSTVKLSDFGVSKQLNGVGEDEQAVAGTPYWMAPEIIELKGASTASDIWSLGCTIIEMITGKPPYLDLKNPMTALFRIVEDDSPPLPDDISDDLRDFFDKCFQRDVDKRWTASALLKHDWIRLKYQDPDTAEESAMLLEVGTRMIQENAMTPSIPQSMDTIPEPTPSFDLETPETSRTPTIREDSFCSSQQPSTSAASMSSTPKDSPLPPPNSTPPSLPDLGTKPDSSSDTSALPVVMRPCRSAPEVHNPADTHVSITESCKDDVHRDEKMKGKKSTKKAKRKSLPGSSKDKDKDCLVM
ncbi:STE/STE11/CDC15 protein kinase [Spizellomyces punctatus DAOM BR117]|uniref:STE/STE11/CDC15 protein kinase n=1 Tax=Spizellomyces punctatus (strain DAOM BR117) TaxID=645134 RepID=A0A0L0HPZ6_SPIPD|nr:STE/STE11/CDC15 protein kinase [Spizellomyces punctatus DAOM BR117]KND02884.1 STE/STE11/CDC15 protein kinase [Spizellomyces punctatus DAOM BR117]|eukprot:XP_016610923.1 STE/STE11/CDC15 protein kinase [Spizellomyces punctatus DAOM BR117]